MVALDGLDDRLGLAEATDEVGADDVVRPLDLVRQHLADVVQERRAADDVDVGPDLRGQHGADVRRLDRVLQLVLAVRRAELEPTDDLDDLGVQAGHAGLVGRRLAFLLDLLLDLLLGLGDDLLDARRMDAPVLDELGQRQARDLAAHRIEARQGHRVGRVVDDQVDTGCRFERADVAALAADDAALHLLVGDGHDGGRDLADGVARVALNGHRQDLARLRLRRLTRLHLDQTRASAGFGAHLLVDALQQQRARLVARQRGDALDGRDLVAAQLVRPRAGGLRSRPRDSGACADAAPARRSCDRGSLLSDAAADPATGARRASRVPRPRRRRGCGWPPLWLRAGWPSSRLPRSARISPALTSASWRWSAAARCFRM